MSKQKDTNSQRRKLLKTVAISGGVIGATQSMPEKWLKPVVDSVILPSHATTSDNSGSLAGDEAITTTLPPADKYYLQIDYLNTASSSERNDSSLLEQLADGLIPPAHAGNPANYVERFFLQHLGGVLYNFVYQATGGYSGLTFQIFFEGNIQEADTRTFNHRRCYDRIGGQSEVTLDKVESGYAYINKDGELYTLKISTGASAPTYKACLAEVE